MAGTVWARLTLATVLLVLVAGLGHPAAARGLGTDRYDACLREAAATWWPAGPGWLWWKAQVWQESRFDEAAVSPVGAAGLAQFMPGTWAEIAPQLGYGHLTPHAACPAIEAGAYYMARLQRVWSSPRPQMRRHELAQASYNAGAGHIIRAQSLCGGARDWKDIAPCLPRVTGHHARETQTYVERIRRWRLMLE